MNSTEKMLVKMLKESTGSQFMDSGGVYGRHWQRNQSRKLTREPQATLDIMAYVDKDGAESVQLSPVLSVFHFLSEALEYAEHEDKALQTFAKRKENEDLNWLQIAEDFAEQYWPNETRDTINTYNGESYLDQTLQYVQVGELEGFIVLSIHQGCDVRGGYGKPRVFRFDTEWSPSLWDVARASISCVNPDGRHGWSVEPGYYQGSADEPNLDFFPSHVLTENESPAIGKLCARKDNTKAFCPMCGFELEASF